LAIVLSFATRQLPAQASSDVSDSLRGMVVNSITHEPIARALVVSADARFATMTDDLGRFEFTFLKAERARPDVSASSDGNLVGVPLNGANRPYALSARKPGFLEENSANTYLALAPNAKELKLSLVPEAVISGQVSQSTSEAPDSIQLQLFSRDVQDGRAHWISAGTAQSKSNGEFRFAGLHAGTYKLLTRELLDRDPFSFDPRGQAYGYPPVYYQDAADFDSATTIRISAGQSVQANVSLVRQPYYNVKVAVANAPPGVGLNVNVYSQGRNGPGYSLGYSPATQTIEGMLPNGTYTVEASNYGRASSLGLLTLQVKGAAVEGARMSLVPGGLVPVNVKEEFTDSEPQSTTAFSNGKRTFTVRGPRRYLNVNLESADEFSAGRNVFLRPPKGPEDDSLVIDEVPPGRYWVHVQSSRGYAASARSGTTDLSHEPLVVGTGGATAPIEITMRDDFATIDGNVDGIAAPVSTSGTLQPDWEMARSLPPGAGPPAHLYCIPLPDGSGEATEIGVAPDGSFASQPLPPGEYRLLAFDRTQPQLEYRNPEAMKVYDNKGPAVRVSGGQKEHVTLHLIWTNE
jgi:hypothetical protein